VLVLPERDAPVLDERIAAASQRLVETLAAIDDGLRRNGLLPAGLARRLPAPTIAVTDCRPESQQLAQPLPARK
jgi:hypothetical protein